MSQVGIIDDDAVKNAPSSKFLTKEEMVSIDSNWIWSRKSIIFKYQIPQYVDSGVAEAMIKKYPSVRLEKPINDYKGVKYNDLKKMAVKKGIRWSDTFVERSELVKIINQAP